MISQELIDAASNFVEAMVAGDFDAAWPMFDSNQRYCQAQQFIWTNRDHETFAGADLELVAADLSGLTSNHPARPAFEELQAEGYKTWPPDWLRGDEWGFAMNRRPVAPDTEVVLLVQQAEEITQVTDHELLAPGTYRVVLFRHTNEGLKVAGVDEYHPPVPGWPPAPGGPIEP